MQKHWIALASMGATMTASIFFAGMRLGALEQKVEQLAVTVAMIAPPTVKIGNSKVVLEKKIEPDFMTAMRSE